MTDIGASVPDRAGGPSDPSPSVSAKGAHPSRVEIFGLECEHHYGITTHPIPAHGDVGREVYRLIREAWHAPREGGGGLRDNDHDWEIVEASAPGRWSRVVIRKNANSPLFAFKPWWCDDGPGALWFSQPYRVATRADIERELEDKLGWAERWEKQADEQRDTIRGRKARSKYSSLAKSAQIEARLIRSRWPQFDGSPRTGWQQWLHRHRDRDVSLAEDAERLSPEGVAARAEGIAQPPSETSHDQ